MARGEKSWTSSFRFRARRGDIFIHQTGRLLDLGEALLRRVGRGDPLLERGDLRRLWGSGRVDDSSAGPAPGPALLYLPAVSWAYRYQRPQQLARAVAELGTPVLYVDGFVRRRVMPELRATAPVSGVAVATVAIAGRPDPYRSRLEPAEVSRLADLVASCLAHPPPLGVVAQLPFWGPLAAELRSALGVPLVYDRIDLHTAFPGVPSWVAEEEVALLEAADVVTATSADLVDRSASHARRVLLLPNAVRLEDFPPRREIPAGPITVGCAGAVDDRFDVEAVLAVAAARPEWRLVFAGRVESAEVHRTRWPDNVQLLGEIPHHRVAGFLGGLHAGFVPHRDAALTRAQDAVKRYEMLAVGLPVVMRRRPELGGLDEPLVYAYETPGEAPELLGRAMAEDGDELWRQRRESIRHETWRSRARVLLEVVAEARRDDSVGAADGREG